MPSHSCRTRGIRSRRTSRRRLARTEPCRSPPHLYTHRSAWSSHSHLRISQRPSSWQIHLPPPPWSPRPFCPQPHRRQGRHWPAPHPLRSPRQVPNSRDIHIRRSYFREARPGQPPPSHQPPLWIEYLRCRGRSLRIIRLRPRLRRQSLSLLCSYVTLPL